jgi:hypothetical protein
LISSARASRSIAALGWGQLGAQEVAAQPVRRRAHRARPQRHGPLQRLEADREDAPAAAHVLREALAERLGQPPHLAGEDHTAVAVQGRPAGARELEVRREVVAQLLFVEIGEQARLPIAESGRQAPAREGTGESSLPPARE